MIVSCIGMLYPGYSDRIMYWCVTGGRLSDGSQHSSSCNCWFIVSPLPLYARRHTPSPHWIHTFTTLDTHLHHTEHSSPSHWTQASPTLDTHHHHTEHTSPPLWTWLSITVDTPLCPLDTPISNWAMRYMLLNIWLIVVIPTSMIPYRVSILYFFW